MAIYLLESPWDIAPDSTSKFEIYNPDDQYILGNGVNPIQKYDGTDFVDLEGGAPKGNIFAVYKDRLMVAGDPSFPHRIWYSHIRNGEGWSKDADWIEVYPEDGGKINGFGIQDDELKISKDNGKMYGWQIFEDGVPTNSRLRIIEDDKGMVNQKSVDVIDNILYYLDLKQFDSIPIVKRGGISFIVDEVIEGIHSFTHAAVGGNDGKIFVALGDVTIDIGDEITLQDAALVYDTINDGVYIRDHMDVRVFSRFIDSQSEELYFGDSNGRVFKLDQGTTANGTTIMMRVLTKPYFRELGRMIHVKRVGIYMDTPDGTVVNYRTDLTQGFMKSLGSVTKQPVEWFSPQDVKGELFQLELVHSNNQARPRLLGIEIEYNEEGKRDDGSNY